MTTSGMKKCPMCAEDIRAEALKCRYCNSSLDGSSSNTPVQQVVQEPLGAAPIVAKMIKLSGGVMGLVRNLISLMVFAILAVVVGTCVVCGKAANDVVVDIKKRGSAAREAVATTPPMDVKAAELEAAYDANEVAADNQFKGKVLRVSGVVEKIRKDLFDGAHITMRSSRSLGGIRCSFEKGQESLVAALVKGRPVVVRCIGDGYVMRSPRLDHCVVEP